MSASAAVVLNFDDLREPFILTGSNYAGLTWEQGNAGLGGIGSWGASSFLDTHPFSQPTAVINGYGCTLIGIGFPTPVDLGGAYIAVQGNVPESWATGLRIHGYLAGQDVGTTALFTSIGVTATWFDMSALTDVDRIVFESIPGLAGNGFYAMDDLIFTYVPEPSGLALLALALPAALARRRRKKANLA